MSHRASATPAIIGRCREVPLEIGHAEFLVDFLVMDMDLEMAMLGLDQMRKFKCIVDLERTSSSLEAMEASRCPSCRLSGLSRRASVLHDTTTAANTTTTAAWS